MPPYPARGGSGRSAWRQRHSCRPFVGRLVADLSASCLRAVMRELREVCGKGRGAFGRAGFRWTRRCKERENGDLGRRRRRRVHRPQAGCESVVTRRVHRVSGRSVAKLVHNLQAISSRRRWEPSYGGEGRIGAGRYMTVRQVRLGDAGPLTRCIGISAGEVRPTGFAGPGERTWRWPARWAASSSAHEAGPHDIGRATTNRG